MRILEFAEDVLTELQHRVETGDVAQRAIFRYIHTNYPELRLGSPRYAKQGSSNSDVVLNINGSPVVFEVKNRTTRHILIQLFSESIRRGETGKRIPIFLKLMGYVGDLTRVIDLARKTDKTIGFAGDPGVDSASGHMPLLGVPPPKVLAALRNFYIRKLQEERVSYLALVTGKEVQLFFTGWGNNVLEAPSLPPVLFARLDTTGPAHYPKSARVCVKVRFR